MALAIWRRRWLFVGTFLATPVYDHKATIEIGYVPDGVGQRRIETAQKRQGPDGTPLHPGGPA